MALKSNQRSQHDVELLNRHAATVERACKLALQHAELFPPEEATKIRKELLTELQTFQGAVQHFEKRVSIKEIRAALAPQQDVRSWLIYRSMPSTIARYSHSQLSASDIAKREEIAARRLLNFHQRYEAAQETIRELPLSKAQRQEVEKKLEAEKRAMTIGFLLYRKGFSFVDIDRITGIRIQSRALDGTIPETTRCFGGDVLSPQAGNDRRVKVERIRADAQQALKEAHKKNADESSDRKVTRFDRIEKELTSLDTALRMYERGLSPNQIRRLTRLPADSWILEGALPVTLLRSSERVRQKHCRMPTTMDAETSYIIGAYLARARSCNQPKISFSAPSAQLAQDLVVKIDRSFGFRAEEPRKEGSRHVVDIAQKEFVSGFKRFFGLSAESVAPCLDLLIFYSYFRRPFLEGFLAFAGGSLDAERSRYALTRTAQEEVVAGVAVALSFEGIYPSLHRAHKQGAVLQICEPLELRSLLEQFPQVGSPGDLEILLRKLPTSGGPLSSLAVYQRIKQIIKRQFSNGRRLNFNKLQEGAEGTLKEISFTAKERAKIKGWRFGHEPLISQRAKKLEEVARRLFPDRHEVL